MVAGLANPFAASPLKINKFDSHMFLASWQIPGFSVKYIHVCTVHYQPVAWKQH